MGNVGFSGSGSFGSDGGMMDQLQTLGRSNPRALQMLMPLLLEKKRKAEEEAARERDLSMLPPEMAEIQRMADISPVAAQEMMRKRRMEEAEKAAPGIREQEAKDEEASARRRFALSQEFGQAQQATSDERNRAKLQALLAGLQPGGGPGGPAGPPEGGAQPGVPPSGPPPGAVPPAGAPPPGAGAAGPTPIADEMYDELMDTMSRLPNPDPSVMQGFVRQSDYEKGKQQEWAKRVQQDKVQREADEEMAAVEELRGTYGEEGERLARVLGPKEAWKQMREEDKEYKAKREADEKEGRDAESDFRAMAGKSKAKRAEAEPLKKQLDAMMKIQATPENEGRLHKERGSLMAKIARLEAEADSAAQEARGLSDRATKLGAGPYGEYGGQEGAERGQQEGGERGQGEGDDQDYTDLRRAQQSLAYMRQKGGSDPEAMAALEAQVKRVQEKNPRFREVTGDAMDADVAAVGQGELPVSREGKIRMYRSLVKRIRDAERRGEEIPAEALDMERELAGALGGGR